MGRVDEYTALGKAFLDGGNVAQDYEQAFFWLSAACELGSDEAEAIVDDMRRRGYGTPCVVDDVAVKAESPRHASWDILPRRTRKAADSAGGVIGGGPRHMTNQKRCVACGCEALVPSSRVRGALRCSVEAGGCGTTEMIPIVEDGLNGGLAMQPYREGGARHGKATYSSLGALIHMVKYNANFDDSLKADMIGEIAGRIRECGVVERLVGGARSDLVVVPAPSTKRRKLQPVFLLAELVAKGRFEYANPMSKRSNVESKSRARGAELAPGDVRCNSRMDGKAILLIDDTYGEGATLRACIRALREKGANEVYFLSVCKNLFGGMKGGSADADDIH